MSASPKTTLRAHDSPEQFTEFRKAAILVVVFYYRRGKWEGGSGWGRHVNSRPFHFNV